MRGEKLHYLSKESLRDNNNDVSAPVATQRKEKSHEISVISQLFFLDSEIKWRVANIRRLDLTTNVPLELQNRSSLHGHQ